MFAVYPPERTEGATNYHGTSECRTPQASLPQRDKESDVHTHDKRAKLNYHAQAAVVGAGGKAEALESEPSMADENAPY